MPDAGDFETRNAPASPPGWGDAFAALPVETPTAAGWERVQARLPAATMPRVRNHSGSAISLRRVTRVDPASAIGTAS